MFYIMFGKFKQQVIDLKWKSKSKSVKHLFLRALAIYSYIVDMEQDGSELWIHGPDGIHRLNIQEEQIGG